MTSKNIKNILSLLDEAYGKAKPFRKTDPVDEIVRTILSQNTNDRNSLGAFAALKGHFKSWEEAADDSVPTIRRLIKHAGLANLKARRIKDVLIRIRRRQGRISLAILDTIETGPALEYLRSFKGVGPKTAACVLLFSFGKPIMPVDTHIFRVAKRLGLIDGRMSVEEAHDVLTALIPKNLIYRLHLGIIAHGRRTCKAQNPRCGFCVLYNICAFKDKRLYKGDEN